jgi:hypothetical protein
MIKQTTATMESFRSMEKYRTAFSVRAEAYNLLATRLKPARSKAEAINAPHQGISGTSTGVLVEKVKMATRK